MSWQKLYKKNFLFSQPNFSQPRNSSADSFAVLFWKYHVKKLANNVLSDIIPLSLCEEIQIASRGIPLCEIFRVFIKIPLLLREAQTKNRRVSHVSRQSD